MKTIEMWCIVDSDSNPLMWTIRETRKAAIYAAMDYVQDMSWAKWSRRQHIKTARCTLTIHGKEADVEDALMDNAVNPYRKS